MVEVITSLCLIMGFFGLLGYIYLHERHDRINRNTDMREVQDMMQQSFKDFLKHIEKLERLNLPKPVTTRDVRSVISRMGEVADESLENEIEKEKNKGVEMPTDEWTGFIGADTKVAFEEEELPTVVEGSEPTLTE